MNNSFKQIEHNFSKLIEETDQIIKPLIESININDIANHNAGYKTYSDNKFKYFVESEKRRFIKALDTITQDISSGQICDLGCFIPYLPIALSLLGYQVKIVDKYELYGSEFKKSILRVAESNSIEVFDLDILQDNFELLNKNDVVLLMAVVEHLTGSPQNLMNKLREIMLPNGFLIFEVPNILEFKKRIRMMLGYSPLPSYEYYFQSKYPFTGHNREMTVSEVVYLLEKTGFEIEWLHCYDYSRYLSRTWLGRSVELMKKLMLIRDKGESIMVKAYLHL
jgi:2-polyprenyl-3-methyl-5-hydroxy-6-metoxy-1,4-benzoquinol methylase